MCKPITDYSVPISGASNELHSGMSALNMEPEPVKEPDGPYLTHRDAMVKHAYSHFSTASQLLNQARDSYEELLRLTEAVLYKHHDRMMPVEYMDDSAKQIKWIFQQLRELRKR